MQLPLLCSTIAFANILIDKVWSCFPFLCSIIAFANILFELIWSCLSCVLQLHLRIYLLIKYGVVSLT